MTILPLRTLFFEDLSVGMTERLSKTVASSDVVGFAQLTGDRNPIHLSEHFAAKTSFRTRIAHGLYTASLISAVLGTRLPGPGAVYISQTLNFRAPVKIGDTVVVTVTVAELIPEKSRARLSCLCEVDGEVVLDGEALVKVPSQHAKGKRPVMKLWACDILVAVGRVPNTPGIGLQEAGVELDSRGYIAVNDRLETTAPDVWALGECAGSPQFTHISEDDFRIVRDNLAGGNRSTRDRLVPYCMFTDPPLAHIGLSEGEAERRGVIARVARLPMDSVLGAQATDQREGFMKALVDENDDRILGFTMIGATAGEVMAAVQTAMIAELPFSRLANVALAHPTMAEGLSMLFSNTPPRSVQQIAPERAA